MARIAVLVPIPDGLKETDAVQLASGSNVSRQVLLAAKSAASVPEITRAGSFTTEESSFLMMICVSGL